MEVTLEDVQDYWQRYCKRHELKPEVMTQGQRFIDLNHDYWADHPMHELKEKVVQHIKKRREEQGIAEQWLVR
jgi:hypothetical protein